MKMSGVLAWVRRWLQWVALPPPWWVGLGIAAAAMAVWLCISASPWAAAVAVLFQVAGAAMALWQFVTLQQGLNPGWLTKEVREWWSRRPRKIPPITASANVTLPDITVRAYASVTNGVEGTVEEQILQVRKKLSALESNLLRVEAEMKVQEQHFAEQMEVHHQAALGFSKAAEQRLSQSLTSAPIQASVGFWLILLGLVMQVWLALP